MVAGSQKASSCTAEVNKAAVASYAMEDRADFADVDRGFVAGFPEKLSSDEGDLLRDGRLFDCVTDDAPAPTR
ncbi:hypothetical protein [Streptomyces sp. NPDC002666]